MKVLRYYPGIREQLQSLPPGPRGKLKTTLDILARSRKDLDVKRLRGDFRHPLERLKVGVWRAAFYQDGDTLYVIRVFPRAQGYDWLTQWETSGLPTVQDDVDAAERHDELLHAGD